VGAADLIATAATYIGIPVADVRTQLAAGKSLTDIATANGKTRDGLIAALLAAEQTSLGTFVDQKGTADPRGFGGPGGPGFGRGLPPGKASRRMVRCTMPNCWKNGPVL